MAYSSFAYIPPQKKKSNIQYGRATRPGAVRKPGYGRPQDTNDSYISRFGQGITGAPERTYDFLYGDPAKQQKEAIEGAIGTLDDLRSGNQQRFGQAKAGALSEMDPAGRAVDAYAAGAPTHLNDLYYSTPRTRAPGGRTRYEGKGPTTLNDLYNGASGAISRMGGATNARAEAFNRLGPSDVENRYKGSGLRESQADANLTGFQSTLRNPAGMGYDTRMTERRNSGPGVLGNYFAQRQGAGPGVLQTDVMLSDDFGRGSLDRADAMASYVDSYDAGRRMKNYSDEYNPREKGYLETFAEDALSGGGDKYYDKGRNDLQKAMQRASAARGGFVAGDSINREGDALSDFEMKRYMNLADIAERGQRMHLDRLGVGFGMEKDIDAMGMEKLGMGLQARQSGLQASLATDAERAGLAKAGDSTRTERLGLMDRLAGMTSEEDQAKQAALDELTAGKERAVGERERLGFDIASTRDKTKQDERSALDRLAGESSKAAQDREFEKNRLAGQQDDKLRDRLSTELDYGKGASDEAGRNLDRDVDIAGAEDEANDRYRDYVARLAKDSSEESRQTLRDIADLKTRIGEIRARLGSNFDLASIDDNTKLLLEQIDLKLKQSGVDAQTRQAMVNDVLSAGRVGAAFV